MDRFRQNILNTFHEKGEKWLSALPTLVENYARLWGLRDLSPCEHLSFHYVLSGYQGEIPIILKLGCDLQNLQTEYQALLAFSGYGAVSVINCEKEAILLQRVIPGKRLKDFHLPPQDSLEIACQVMEKLHKAPIPKNGIFPHVQDLFGALDRNWDISEMHLVKARKLKNDLFHRLNLPLVLLHGDLHKENILSDENNWLVIDPKGMIGYSINEIWAFIEDPQTDLAYVAKRFHFSLEQVTRWYYVHLILAACWCVEDRLSPKLFLDLASTILPML